MLSNPNQLSLADVNLHICWHMCQGREDYRPQKTSSELHSSRFWAEKLARIRLLDILTVGQHNPIWPPEALCSDCSAPRSSPFLFKVLNSWERLFLYFTVSVNYSSGPSLPYNSRESSEPCMSTYSLCWAQNDCRSYYYYYYYCY